MPICTPPSGHSSVPPSLQICLGGERARQTVCVTPPETARDLPCLHLGIPTRAPRTALPSRVSAPGSIIPPKNLREVRQEWRLCPLGHAVSVFPHGSPLRRAQQQEWQQRGPSPMSSLLPSCPSPGPDNITTPHSASGRPSSTRQRETSVKPSPAFGMSPPLPQGLAGADKLTPLHATHAAYLEGLGETSLCWHCVAGVVCSHHTEAQRRPLHNFRTARLHFL